jgi:hypothetical protein
LCTGGDFESDSNTEAELGVTNNKEGGLGLLSTFLEH